jgi:pimeloyl-ACP methyl ester carboxylesterase
VHQAVDMISVDPTYCLMPEASGPTLLQNLKDLCRYIYTRLEKELQEINPCLSIAWDQIYLFGISFGGWMAIGLYLELGRQSTRPPGTHIRALILRCPVVKEYQREPGNYMNLPISKERAERDSAMIYDLSQQMPFVIHRAGRFPPDGMYGAHVFSVSHRYGLVWAESTMFSLIEEAEACPDNRTRVCILHGNADQNVPIRLSQDVQELFRKKKWPNVDLVIQEEKSHAWDYREPLTKELKDYLDSSSVE